mmetsp:Transcript_133176/g.414085  ORF Transcript_133176/g.414085 Transcript_133176/m.414085 type:complete len:208 (-) Transcript_133176:40-663(-)
MLQPSAFMASANAWSSRIRPRMDLKRVRKRNTRTIRTMRSIRESLSRRMALSFPRSPAASAGFWIRSWESTSNMLAATRNASNKFHVLRRNFGQRSAMILRISSVLKMTLKTTSTKIKADVTLASAPEARTCVSTPMKAALQSTAPPKKTFAGPLSTHFFGSSRSDRSSASTGGSPAPSELMESMWETREPRVGLADRCGEDPDLSE